jgi:hypothetical protein
MYLTFHPNSLSLAVNPIKHTGTGKVPYHLRQADRSTPKFIRVAFIGDLLS